MGEQEVGVITHYFTRIGVAIVELSAPLKVGDEILIKGATSDWTQRVESMHIEHDKVTEAKKGTAIGLHMNQHAREGDTVFKES